VQGHTSQPSDGATGARGADPDAPADEVIALSVETGEDRSLAVVHVTGEVDMLTTPLLRSTLIQQLDNGVRQLVVDLREVTFLGSSGLGVLVEALKAARRHDATLQLVCTSRAVTRPLAVTGLSQVFDIRDDVPDSAGLSPTN
jgi:anti-sigma B factor antagonist